MSYFASEEFVSEGFGAKMSRDNPMGLPMLERDPTCMTLWDCDPHGGHWVGRPGLSMMSQRCSRDICRDGHSSM